MNSILAYVFIISVVRLSVNAIYDDNIAFNPVLVKPLDVPYYFKYISKFHTISMTLFLDNNFSSAVEVSSLEHRRSEIETTYKKRWEIKARQKYYYNYRIKLLGYKQIIWQLKFVTNASCFDTVTIFNGTASDRNSSGSGYVYDSTCLRTDPCLVHLYLQDKCLGTTSVTTDNLQKGTTSVTTDNSQKGSETSILAIVMSSLFSIVFIVLVIIVIWICCWIKHSPQGIVGVQTNHTQPFYLNMLFRRECDQEIAEMEQHHYEEIVPGVVEGN